jgi:hypothetical protein
MVSIKANCQYFYIHQAVDVSNKSTTVSIISCWSNKDDIAVVPAAAAWNDQAPLGTWTCIAPGTCVAYSDCTQESVYGQSHQRPCALPHMYAVAYLGTGHDDPSPPMNYMDSSAMPVVHE